MILRFRKIYVFSLAMLIAAVAFVFTVRTNNAAREASAQAGIDLPVIMYHHITKNEKRAGKYVVMLSTFEEDLKFIKENGFTTVTVEDLINFVNGKAALPKRPIMITFDDGFLSTYEFAGPLLKKNNMKAVVSVVGSYTDQFSNSVDKNVNYAYLTWDDLYEMNLKDEFEIQNHTYDMHYSKSGERKGLSRINGESREKYEQFITDDLLKMQSLLKTQSGINATAIAFPYGAYSKTTNDIVKKLGFQSSFLCEERINKIIPGDRDSLYNLGRFNRPSGITSKDFFEKIVK